MKIKTLIGCFVFFLIGVLPVHSYYIEHGVGNNKTVTGDLNFTIFCRDNLTITKIEQLYGSQTAGSVIDLVLPSETVRATTTGTTGVLTYNFTGQTCLASSTIPATLDYISGDTSWTYRRLLKTGSTISGYTPDVPNTLIYAEADEPTYWFPQNYTFSYTHVIIASSTSASSSSSVATTTIISINDQLLGFTLLYFIFAITLALGIMLIYPLYARK